MKQNKKTISINKNYKDFLSFSLDFNHSLFDPNNFFLVLGKKKNLNLFFLNPELLKMYLKQSFCYFKKFVKLKTSLIFIGQIKNQNLLQIFKYFCAKNKLIFIDLNEKSNMYQYKLFLKKKNLVFINLFLEINTFLTIQKDSSEYNIPVLNFLSLQHSKYNAIASYNGLINHDYIQFLIVLTLINIYEKI